MLPVVPPIFKFREVFLILSGRDIWETLSALYNPLYVEQSSEYDLGMAYRFVKYASVLVQSFLSLFGIVSYFIIYSLENEE